MGYTRMRFNPVSVLSFFLTRTGSRSLPLALFFVFFSSGCKKESPILPETEKAFGEAAERFCGLTADCLRSEMEHRFETEAQRRYYLAGRMTRSACQQARFRMLQTHPGEVKDLESCSALLKESGDCSVRLNKLKKEDACRHALHL